MKRPGTKTVFRLGALFLWPALCSAVVCTALVAVGTAPASASSTPMAASARSHLPARVLSLSASATQMLYGIGAGHQVVGVDKYSTYPPGTPLTKFTGYETNAEDYLYLRPDLVIFPFKTDLVEQLDDLGIPSLVLPPPSNFAGAYAQISQLGTVTGHEAGARALNASLRAYLSASEREAGTAGRGATYYIELDPVYYYTATSKTFIGAEFSLFGMKDIADPAGHGSGYPAISAEYILKANPDYVFLADTVCCHQTAATFAKRPGFSSLKAVKLHHVIGVNDSVASQWGPHTIEVFVKQIASTLR